MRGSRGLYRRSLLGGMGRVYGWGRSGGSGTSRVCMGHRPEVGGASDGWGHPISKKERGCVVPLRGRGKLGRGPFFGSAGFGPAASLPFFSSFSFIFFCFSLFFL
jgi:hypothetical protein